MCFTYLKKMFLCKISYSWMNLESCNKENFFSFKLIFIN